MAMTSRWQLFLVGLSLVCAVPSSAVTVVPGGFTVTSFPLDVQVTGLVASPGGAYGNYLYASASGKILRVDPVTGVSSTFATGLATGSGSPTGLAFDAGAFGGGYLYVSQNNGSVVRVSPAGAVTNFSVGGTLASSNDLSFGPAGGAYSHRLFVSNGGGVPASISSVDSTGLNSIFSASANFTGIPLGLGFPIAQSAFVPRLFATQYNNVLLTVDAAGTTAPFANGLGTASDIAFSYCSAFGDFMYVSDLTSQRVFRVSENGTTSIFAQGFAFGTDGWDGDLAFSPDGAALYVANDTAIVKITGGGYFDAALDPRGTYLRTNADPSAASCRIIDLLGSGIAAGDTLRIIRNGAFEYHCTPGFPQGNPSDPDGLRAICVFSSSNVLLSSGSAARVPGAIDAGQDYVTPPTFVGNLPTDIPEDFAVVNSVAVAVPTGAQYLFVAASDEFYGDNCSPSGDYGVTLLRNRECMNATSAVVENGQGWLRDIVVAWPNPSSSGATIELRGAGSLKDVTAAVYDVAGRKVRTLRAGDISQSVSQAFWDGADERGVRVAAGVYFVRMGGEHRQGVTRIMILK